MYLVKSNMPGRCRDATERNDNSVRSVHHRVGLPAEAQAISFAWPEVHHQIVSRGNGETRA